MAHSGWEAGDILPERADQLREGVESAVEERRLRTGPISGDELAAEMAAEVKLQVRPPPPPSCPRVRFCGCCIDGQRAVYT